MKINHQSWQRLVICLFASLLLATLVSSNDDRQRTIQLIRDMENVSAEYHPFSNFESHESRIASRLVTLPTNQLPQFCHSSATHLKVCSEHASAKVRAVILAYQLNVWLKSLHVDFGSCVPLITFQGFDASEVTLSLLSETFKTWYTWVRCITDDAMVVSSEENQSIIQAFQDRNFAFCENINFRQDIDTISIWTLLLELDDIYQILQDTFVTWFNVCSQLEIQLLTYPQIFDFDLVEEIFSDGHLASQSITILTMLENRYVYWFLPYAGQYGLLDKLRHWTYYIRTPLYLFEEDRDLDVIRLDHPHMGDVLRLMMNGPVTRDHLDEIIKVCNMNDHFRAICLRGEANMAFDLHLALVQADAARILQPYHDTIQKMRLFDGTDSVREWDRNLRHLYVDFSRFFCDSDWPLSLYRWASRGDLISQSTPSPATMEIFRSQLKMHWVTFVMFCEREWKRWRAKLTFLMYLTQTYQKDILKLKKKELTSVDMCFERSLIYSGVCVIDLLSKTLSEDIKTTKHHALYSSYPDILERLRIRLGTSLFESTCQKLKMELPAIYADLLEPLQPIVLLTNGPQPQEWMGRRRAATQSGSRRPPMPFSRSTTRVPFLRPRDDDESINQP